MITSVQQRNKVLARIESLKSQLQMSPEPHVPVQVVAVAKSQIRESMAALESEIKEFEWVRQANLDALEFSTFSEFLKIPIIIRLAKRLSIPVFANTLGISESQLKRYESETYRNAPSGLVDVVLSKYHLRINGKVSHDGGHEPLRF